jgi:hypothetical protein
VKQSSPEIGSVVMLEHVNLRVPDHRLATLYFVEGLGLTRDPFRMVGTRNMWVNAGHHQFHLPIGPASPLPGEVGVVVPDLDGARRQLEAVEPELAGTAFSAAREGPTLATTTPWGHRVRVHGQGSLPGRMPQALAYVDFWVRPGTAEGIGAFYRERLECPVEPARLEGDVAAIVTMGSYQVFRFRERPDGGTVSNDNHVAIYLTRYRSLYAELDKRGLVMERDEDEQFRFCDIADPGTGEVLFTFEHEVRSLHHHGYRRPLVNRIPVPQQID